MITYYIGNIREKRKLFRSPHEGAAVADNCDVLADFGVNGKICMVLGDIPYADMRVGEYLSYTRALKAQAPLSAESAGKLLRRVGVKVSLDKKMGSLSRFYFRGVLLAAALNDDTTEAWLNLDGIAYSPAAKMGMLAMLRRATRNFENVHVSVSDYRFIPRSANSLAVTTRGTVPGKPKSVSRRYVRLRFCKKKRRESLVLSALSGRKTVLCDG